MHYLTEKVFALNDSWSFCSQRGMDIVTFKVGQLGTIQVLRQHFFGFLPTSA